jgi:hypothetical protein
MDYSYFYIEEIRDITNLTYDIFISGFEDSERTRSVYEKINAKEKYWFVFPQYSLKIATLPEGYVSSRALAEDEYILEVMGKISIRGKSLCLDATGFLIPHLLFLLQYFKRQDVKILDVLYSEPASYIKAEDTEFIKYIDMPRPIEGYATSPKTINGEDALVIFSGFSEELVTAVARQNSKAHSKYLFTGFPSLQADMYQQNMIQLEKSKLTIGQTNVTYLSAPAYDPFVAANRLQKIVTELLKKNPNIEYIHVSPLSTKPMAIAAALVYLDNPDKPIDIIYPPAKTYASGHTRGIKRTWKYTLEFE